MLNVSANLIYTNYLQLKQINKHTNDKAAKISVE